MSKSTRRQKDRPRRHTAAAAYEAEVLPGLKPFAQAELQRYLGQQIAFEPTKRDDQLRFSYRGSPVDLLALRTVVAVYRRLHYPIPRPKALLGHQHLHHLLGQITTVRALHPTQVFQTFRISAAGDRSSVFSRLKQALASHCGLVEDRQAGDLFIRVRPAPERIGGWEVLLRLSPRPLATRSWRAWDMAGALNATIAAAMIELTQPHRSDRFLNLMCGSGTLLIERLARAPVRQLVGGDSDPIALAGAGRNITAANLPRRIDLLQLEATTTPLQGRSFNVICADLPWGQRVGSHSRNLTLYPDLLAEVTRLALPGARLVLLTHEMKLLEGLLPALAGLWRVDHTFQIFQGGLHPKLYLLRRVGGRL